MYLKIAIVSLIGTIISIYSYKFYMNKQEEENYLSKSFIKEDERTVNNNCLRQKKTYIKTIIIKKKIDNDYNKKNNKCLN
jgi:hypothetical protein